jgi:diguanylate cyclase (GGDEF)-like protein
MISLNRRILIVDDNVDIHNDFRKILGNPAKSGSRSALSMIENQLFADEEPEEEVEADGNLVVEYEIDSAYQGLDAVEMVEAAYEEERPYALIFMDVRMPPGIDGIETISRIWKRFPFVEVIICTAYSDYSFEEIIDKLGTTDRLLFLTKPFDSIAVKQMALSLARKWTLHEEARRHVKLLQNEISQRKASEERLHHLIHHDSLTGLANRMQLQISINEAIAEARGSHTRFALIFVGLDRFREVIDTLGYHNGDKLIRKVADRLKSNFSGGAEVFCLGDQEFAVLIPAIKSRDHTVRLARRLEVAFEPHFDLDGFNIEVRLSLGVVIYPDHGCNPDMLMRRADMTLIHAKKEQGLRFFQESLNSYSSQRLLLLSDLRRTIQSDELMLYFQPIVYLKNNLVVALEALVRWPHPEHGFIPPSEFIPIAERCGLIKDLTAWVLNEVPKKWSFFKDRGYDLTISVNLTANDLQNIHLPEMIDQALRASEMPLNRLVFEVSEKGVMEDPEQAINIMNRIVEMGVRVSIDNFGTGYSSLAYLKMLPASEIKIDRSFVREHEHKENDIAIVKSMVDLGHNLGLRVLAEGVNAPFMLRQLNQMGCDFLQGDLVNHPVPAGELVLWFDDAEWDVNHVEKQTESGMAPMEVTKEQSSAAS